MEKLNVGQVVTWKEDQEVVTALGEEKHIIKKGTKAWVGASKRCPMLYFSNCKSLLLSKDTEIEGYSVNGLAEWIYKYLLFYFPLEEFFEDYDSTKDEFLEKIADALEEIDMWDNTGNRS